MLMPIASPIEVIMRRTYRHISLRVQLRITHMDVCCGPPIVYVPATI